MSKLGVGSCSMALPTLQWVINVRLATAIARLKLTMVNFVFPTNELVVVIRVNRNVDLLAHAMISEASKDDWWRSGS